MMGRRQVALGTEDFPGGGNRIGVCGDCVLPSIS